MKFWNNNKNFITFLPKNMILRSDTKKSSNCNNPVFIEVETNKYLIYKNDSISKLKIFYPTLWSIIQKKQM